MILIGEKVSGTQPFVRPAATDWTPNANMTTTPWTTAKFSVHPWGRNKTSRTSVHIGRLIVAYYADGTNPFLSIGDITDATISHEHEVGQLKDFPDPRSNPEPA